MSSIPPTGDAPSDQPNPFQAPQSSYKEEPLPAVAGKPGVVEFSELIGKSFQVVFGRLPLFLVCTLILGVQNALFAASSHFVLLPAMGPPIDFRLAALLWAGLTAVQLPIMAWIYCGMTHAWIDACQGRAVGVETLLSGLPWTSRAIGINLLIFPPMMIGFALCCIPGIYVAAVTGAATVILIAEDRGVFDCFQRCYDLTRPSVTAIGLVYFCFLFGIILLVSPLILAAQALPKPMGEVAMALPQGANTVLLIVLNGVVYFMTTGVPIVVGPPIERSESSSTGGRAEESDPRRDG